MAKNQKDKKEIKVNAGAVTGSQYSQLVGITVTDFDVTLEFVYINPRIKTEGQVISRITLPRSVGENLAQQITSTVKKHESEKGNKNV